MKDAGKTRRQVGLLIGLLLIAFATPAFAALPKPAPYGERYCDQPGFHCVTIGKYETEFKQKTKDGVETVTRKGRTWKKLWPDENERTIVMKINRMNIRLRKGMIIAVPDDMEGKTYMDFAPFPRKLKYECEPVGEPVCELVCEDCEEGSAARFKYVCEQQCAPKGDLTCGPEGKLMGKKLIIIDLARLAFAAYDDDGTLLRWGPVSGGRNWGRYVRKDRLTPAGDFAISKKFNRWAKSALYPKATKDRPQGGAPVPYFMRFSPGFGLHHYHTVPGRHASHGCVRLFFDDAKWLNLEFAKIGTKVTVRPYE